MILLWIKSLHIIAVIAWMAGMLYLPRLYVYHADAETGSRQSETFKIMEQRLLRTIMTPAAVLVWLTGPWLAWQFGMLGDHWLWLKFALVIGLTGYHFLLVRWFRNFAADNNVRPAIFFRAINEIPALLMVGIVVLVVVKPF